MAEEPHGRWCRGMGSCSLTNPVYKTRYAIILLSQIASIWIAIPSACLSLLQWVRIQRHLDSEGSLSSELCMSWTVVLQAEWMAETQIIS